MGLIYLRQLCCAVAPELRKYDRASLSIEYPITRKEIKTAFLLTHDWKIEISRASPHLQRSGATAPAHYICF